MRKKYLQQDPESQMEYPNIEDQYFDLRGLEAYSALKVGTLRDYIRRDGLPCFKVRGKVIIRRSGFDRWLERFRINRNQDINIVVNEIMKSLKVVKQSKRKELKKND
jgi:hypothetical protein